MKEKLKKHKKLIIISLIVIVLIIATLIIFKTNKNNRNKSIDFSYVRTVTLSKSSLTDTIVASGNIESQTTSTITSGVNGATISKINYSIGDYVKEGDVIIELDQTNLNKQITKQSEKINEQKESLQDRYNDAADTLDDAEDSYNSAKSARNNAANAFAAAKNAISTYQNAYDTANTNYNSAINACLANEDKACDLLDDENEYKIKWNAKKSELDNAKKTLDAAKEAANYDNLEKAYNSAQETYSKAKQTYQQAENSFSDAEDTLNDGVDSDSLDELYDTVSDYKLKAKSDGQITNINAVLGSSTSGTLATIQDTSKLKIALTIDEYDILKLELGMKAIIETDASDKTYEGEISQISPVASSGMGSSGGFEIEVVVTSDDITGLLIGMNAEVTIIVSETNENFNVPIDAVETKTNGTKVIYVENSKGEFDELVVETGETNGYYVEIISNELQEGMRVRASANIDEATVDVVDNEDFDFSDFSGNGFDMGGFPGGVGSIPQGGGGFNGAPSRGGFSGGGMPGGR